MDLSGGLSDSNVAHVEIEDGAICRSIITFLHSVGLHRSAAAVEAESGFSPLEHRSKETLFLRRAVLEGHWDRVLDIILPLRDGIAGYGRAVYAIKRQEFFELLEERSSAANEEAVSAVLVSKLNGIEAFCSTSDFNALCYCMTLPSVQSHPELHSWSVHGGRVQVFDEIWPVVRPVLEPGRADGDLDGGQPANLALLCRMAVCYQQCCEKSAAPQALRAAGARLAFPGTTKSALLVSEFLHGGSSFGGLGGLGIGGPDMSGSVDGASRFGSAGGAAEPMGGSGGSPRDSPAGAHAGYGSAGRRASPLPDPRRASPASRPRSPPRAPSRSPRAPAAGPPAPARLPVPKGVAWDIPKMGGPAAAPPTPRAFLEAGEAGEAGRSGGVGSAGGEDREALDEPLLDVAELRLSATRVFDAESGAAIRCVSWAPSGRTFAVGGSGRSLQVCAVPRSLHEKQAEREASLGGGPGDVLDLGATERCAIVHERPSLHKGSVYSIAWHPTEQLLATCSNDKTVRLVRPQGPSAVGTAAEGAGAAEEGQASVLRGHNGTVRAVKFLQLYSPGASPPTSAAPDPPAPHLLSGGAGDCAVRVWDAAAARLVRTCDYHDGSVTCFESLSSPNLFLSGALDGSCAVWDLRQRAPLRVLQHREGHAVHAAAAIAGGAWPRVATATQAGVVHCWDLSSGVLVGARAAHAGESRSVAFDARAGLLLSAGFDGRVCVAAAGGGDLLQPMRAVEAHAEHRVLQARWCPGGPAEGLLGSFLSCGTDGAVRLWRVKEPRRSAPGGLL